jgi:hypothetical protein
MIFFIFFVFFGGNHDFKIKPPFLFSFFFDIYIYIFQQEQNKIKNLGLDANFNQESIKKTLTYD